MSTSPHGMRGSRCVVGTNLAMLREHPDTTTCKALIVGPIAGME